ncbi:MAG: DUF2141 domain-containing protein [Myxococcota bacterium]|nr:DUF2141 domain-containing protein [Myxococcota bacterium]
MGALFFATTHAARSGAQSGEQIVFVVHGLRVDAGIVRGGIYASSEGWTLPGRQVAVCTARPARGTARCAMVAPGPGRYAFAFFHDADDDEALDRDLVGIPQEGYGFSNDVRPGLGPPSFDDAAFTVAAGQRYQARVTTQYGWSP